MLDRWDANGPLRRLGLVAAGCTLVLTACFIGIISLLEGLDGVSARMPLYVLALAAAFATTVFVAEQRHYDGRAILVTSLSIAGATFVIVLLAVEGLIFTYNNPATVLNTDQLPYLLAAGLLGTGFGYWVIRHWREFAARRPNNGL